MVLYKGKVKDMKQFMTFLINIYGNIKIKDLKKVVSYTKKIKTAN